MKKGDEMNYYAKMIEILVAVKASRKQVEQDGFGPLGSSPFVCDNVNRFIGDDAITRDAKGAIRAAIAVIIEHSFGVPEFLGLDTDYDDYGNSHPDVIAFRATMIDNLIARYTEAQNAAV